MGNGIIKFRQNVQLNYGQLLSIKSDSKLLIRLLMCVLLDRWIINILYITFTE